jgi:hypothetical protein
MYLIYIRKQASGRWMRGFTHKFKDEQQQRWREPLIPADPVLDN